ncbi:putative Beta-(1--_2)glucan export ATP-binding protein (Attachment protein)(chvA) (fragment) [Nitrolancea hollandica Lb]|uniref:Putative Beta-(1-->2)glucan export ATP-binding protein (Attachment protein)(ChvA) n=1 Tax=Nitrolancea hollandica Lb TaxID=1129897 RepID=I4EIV1_9BACT
MLQDTFLFDGTVRDNIVYGRPDATDGEVIAAATAVGAHEFITRLEQGYDTPVHERGVTLSVGQRQLLSFARALLADPRIIILDEATSSVDTETEVRIQQALRRLLSGRTAFIIAHRLSTIKEVSRVVVMHHGRIVEIGTHEELLDRRGFYYNLYTMQFAAPELQAAD